MAPRGRTRRQQHRTPRLTRMDAAIDHMAQFGFSEDTVRTTVKYLLKEYGGDEGWTFIEGEAYQLLIDTILNEQDRGGKEQNLLENALSQEGGAGNDPMTSAAEPSGGGLLALTSTVVVSTASETMDIEMEDDFPPVEEDGRGREIIVSDENFHRKETVNATGGVDNNSRRRNSGTPLDSTQMHSSQPLLPSPSPSPASRLCPRVRKPCYGWISSDDEEPDDFINLKPMKSGTMPGSPTVIRGRERRAKRKTMWDVRPDDM